MLAKLTFIATISIAGSALAETVPSFEADACNPGYNEEGQFVDGQGQVFDQIGWKATAVNVVVDSIGRRVVLNEDCLSQLNSEEKKPGAYGTALGALLVVGVLTGLGGSTGTNGTTD